MKLIDLKISLKYLQPSIWRRIKVSSQLSLLDLHYVIQHAFGWTNSHLFIIKIGSMEFVNTSDWNEDDFNFQSAELSIIDDIIPKLLSKGSMFSYLYDIGDHWEHEILIESIDDSNKTIPGAVCVSGERACPPEDVGSVPGYYELIEALDDPTSEDFSEYLAWLGYVYDPEAFDLKSANLFIQDYFKSTQLSNETYWTKDLPFYNPRHDFISDWIDYISPELRQYAESLAFRRDVVTFLIYLKENKVKGTKATGNFPRKDIRAIWAGFVHHPPLDLKIGDRVYQLRTEDEVPELIFIHNFVNEAGLIIGGENMLWTVTQLGEKFLACKPEEQAWFLTKFWFYQFNWENCYQFTDAMLNENIYYFQQRLLEVLLKYPIGKPIEIESLIKEIDLILPGWIITSGYEEFASNKINHFLLRVVVEPFEKLGLFETCKVQSEFFEDFYKHTHIIMTAYGQSLLQYFK